MTLARVFFFLLPLLSSAATSSLSFLPYDNAVAVGLLPIAKGGVAIYGWLQLTCDSTSACNQTLPPLLSLSDASGNVTAALSHLALGGGDSIIYSAAMDGSGNIWITGTTDSDDFPLLGPLFTQKPAYQPTGFVAKLDPSLNVMFSTFLGGPGPANPQLAQTTPRSIALDTAGNAYVAGQTGDPNFPTTGPVFGTGAPGAPPLTFTFVSKISADGSKLLFSRLLGGNGSPCVGGTSCNGFAVYSTPGAIAVDTSGGVTIVGATNATNYPITANVYNTGGGAYVTRISADGSQLVWSTELGVINTAFAQATFSSAQSAAIDSSGNVFITGYAPSPIAATPGVLQPTVNVPSTNPGAYGYVAKLSSDATQLLYATNLGGSSGARIYGLTLDSVGNVWIAGNTKSVDFPGLSNVPITGLDFALELNSSASAIQQIFALLPGTVTDLPAFDSNGNLLLLATAGNLLRLNPATALTAPAVFAILNSAVPYAAAGVAPGELLTLYGTALGPSTGIVGGPDQNGLFPTKLGGVEVDFFSGAGSSGVPAPLLYVGAGQINLQVPFAFALPATITITTPTAVLAPLIVPLISSVGVFGVVNQDGTVNSASNPAPVGSPVSIYLTGLGAPSTSGSFTPNGAISSSANNAFQDSILIFQSNSFQPLPVLYAGTAPGLINGLDQIDVQLPANVPNPSLNIEETNLRTGFIAASVFLTVYTK